MLKCTYENQIIIALAVCIITSSQMSHILHWMKGDSRTIVTDLETVGCNRDQITATL